MQFWEKKQRLNNRRRNYFARSSRRNEMYKRLFIYVFYLLNGLSSAGRGFPQTPAKNAVKKKKKNQDKAEFSTYIITSGTYKNRSAAAEEKREKHTQKAKTAFKTKKK